MKHIAYGTLAYWSDPLHAFDGVLVVLIMFELIFGNGAVATSVRAVRLFRFLRALRGLRAVRVYRNTAFSAKVAQQFAHQTVVDPANPEQTLDELQPVVLVDSDGKPLVFAPNSVVQDAGAGKPFLHADGAPVLVAELPIEAGAASLQASRQASRRASRRTTAAQPLANIIPKLDVAAAVAVAALEQEQEDAAAAAAAAAVQADAESKQQSLAPASSGTARDHSHNHSHNHNQRKVHPMPEPLQAQIIAVGSAKRTSGGGGGLVPLHHPSSIPAHLFPTHHRPQVNTLLNMDGSVAAGEQPSAAAAFVSPALFVHTQETAGTGAGAGAEAASSLHTRASRRGTSNYSRASGGGGFLSQQAAVLMIQAAAAGASGSGAAAASSAFNRRMTGPGAVAQSAAVALPPSPSASMRSHVPEAASGSSASAIGAAPPASSASSGASAVAAIQLPLSSPSSAPLGLVRGSSDGASARAGRSSGLNQLAVPHTPSGQGGGVHGGFGGGASGGAGGGTPGEIPPTPASMRVMVREVGTSAGGDSVEELIVISGNAGATAEELAMAALDDEAEDDDDDDDDVEDEDDEDDHWDEMLAEEDGRGPKGQVGDPILDEQGRPTGLIRVFVRGVEPRRWSALGPKWNEWRQPGAAFMILMMTGMAVLIIAINIQDQITGNAQ